MILLMSQRMDGGTAYSCSKHSRFHNQRAVVGR
jgi:hypothetical protein